jgi:hypothetical protein
MSKELTSTEKYYRTAVVNQRKSESLGTRALSDYKHGDVRPSLGRHELTSQFLNYRVGAKGYPTVLYGKTLALARQFIN